MKKILKFILFLLIALILICGIAFITDKNEYAQWTVKPVSKNKSGISWAKFYWVNDSLNGKYIERTAMFIPAKIPGINADLVFQFDLGAARTMLNENSIRSFKNSSLKIERLKNPLLFWNKKKAVKNLVLNFGELTAETKNCYVIEKYGDDFSANNIDAPAPFNIGSVGADMFQDKVLIIDYPNQRFVVCDSVPPEYSTDFTDIELSSGRIVLPMKFKNKIYRVMFDNGSSIFPLITQEKNSSIFSSGPDTDTIHINSWGKTHAVTGKIISDSFELAGQKFSSAKIYTNHSGLGIDPDTDAMAGNALFWNKTVIIDFKHKKFGVK